MSGRLNYRTIKRFSNQLVMIYLRL